MRLSYPVAHGVSRRDVLKYAAAAPAVLGFGAGLQAVSSVAAAPRASAEPIAAPMGILLDYAAGVIKAADIRAAGPLGAIRYVSDRRPRWRWMLGKPIQLPEARDLYQNGLKIVSCYQYGKQDSADWLGGQTAGRRARQARLATARRGRRLLRRADLRLDRRRPDSLRQYQQQVAPYLRGWEAVLGHQRVGVYANSKTIDWALQDGLGSYFWQHNWGSPKGSPIPPHTCIRCRSTEDNVGGRRRRRQPRPKPRFGQWD